MAKYRIGRINEEMMKAMAQILRGVKDPRVSDCFISVTGCEVTPDLKYAKVYYSFLHGDKKEVASGLKAANPYIRHELSQNMDLRITPELTFILDESLANGAHISALLHSIETGTPAKTAENQTDEKEN